jgi:hypothetical protein
VAEKKQYGIGMGVLSPTALKTFATCPRKYQAMYITKEVKYTQSPAAVRGDKLHTLMEAACREGWNTIQWPEAGNMQHARGFVQAVANLKAAGWLVRPELQTAVSRDGKTKDWFDKAPESFLRSRIDICATNPAFPYAIVIDWKTGKKYDVDTIQLAINAMCLQPQTGISDYKMMFAYLDSGDVVEHSCHLPPVPFSRYGEVVHQLHPDVAKVYELIGTLEEQYKVDVWPEKANRFCDWCDVQSCPKKQGR